MMLDQGNHNRSGTSGRKFRIFCTSAIVHAVLILGPLGAFALADLFSPPKPNPFRVKIGGRELSTAPQVGMPERKRPGPKGDDRPAPPKEKPKDKPKVPDKPKEKPKETPKPKPKEHPKPAPKPKPTAKPTVKPKPAPKQPQKQPTKTDSGKTNSRRQTNNNAKPKRDLQSEVYRPSGGSNTNANVPIGSRDVGQKLGKPDNRTPGGGATEADEIYGRNLGNYLRARWTQPSEVFLGNQRPSVLIELVIAADGRVTASRIITPSNHAEMDSSIRRLLSVLDRVPRPPRGATTLQISLQTE